MHASRSYRMVMRFTPRDIRFPHRALSLSFSFSLERFRVPAAWPVRSAQITVGDESPPRRTFFVAGYRDLGTPMTSASILISAYITVAASACSLWANVKIAEPRSTIGLGVITMLTLIARYLWYLAHCSIQFAYIFYRECRVWNFG